MPTLTFTKTFKAEGQGKNGKPWIRWDYKTDTDERFVRFAASADIPLNVPVTFELEGDNKIGSWFVSANGANPHSESSNGSEAGRTAPVASQGPSREVQIHRQTASKVAAKLMDLYEADEQTLETFFLLAEKLVDYYANGVQETVPF